MELIFYERLKKLIDLSNKSFNEVERELNYPRNSLHNYKNGAEPSAIRLIELSNHFGVSPEYLIGVKNSKEKSVEMIFNDLNDQQKKDMITYFQYWILDHINIQL
ncbi:helix-turn-helix domain-containing protein [Lactococcus lactis]|jgi:transcriptional regulator with XRE-family HTH domain|uniref:helix-turn-helix domain-containing protein n=1 Tax=Lactococcus lactis TaxID=1358 RepID=UPI000571B339|nr:helix-turn-helix transcriptional regulator [Lactococcus lactis]MCQ4972282.1 helix-turn-helix domain-containing protein [Lactococcus lactis]MCQ4998088.1 helix-turn-helix domain-containing protein [Lactococcus lactis]MDG4963447.1 helix-turn-helix domain-containing protein [Lactococcus lactis]PPA68135.1 XRE family transcriptional regulator [Lactococcus lactis]QEA60311.1 helix-turn-helix transcriptional regulator [Lactococcus lactis]